LSADAPLVSIILPTYNRSAFLRATLESVFAQTFDSWELIVADDGSEAETQALLRSYSCPRVKILWLAHTGNPATVRNQGLKEARGEYIAFLDSDDMWLPQKLEEQIASLCLHPSCGWSYTRFVPVDEFGNLLTGARARPTPALAGWILEDLVSEQTLLATSSVVVRRELLERIGGFDCELPVCEDLYLYVRLALQSEIDVIDRPLVHLRRHGHHYADDLTALKGLERALLKMQCLALPRSLQLVVRKRLAGTSTGIARRYAERGSTLRALGTVASSSGYSWRYRTWWSGASTACALALAPRPLVRVLRACKRSLKVRLARGRSVRAP